MFSVDAESIKIWQKFNYYNFVESSHQYYYYDKPVSFSVTQYISRFFPEFDKENISKKYALKHNMTQEEVLADWQRKGDISAISGTIVHAYLENAKRGKTFDIDYSPAVKAGIELEVKDRVNILLPKAKAFHNDTLGKLYPVQLEYTVGIQDVIAGNIDMLCWNDYAKEFQIWDYKNTKEMAQTNYFGNTCLGPFSWYPDCSYIHYSMQLNVYKAILQRELGVSIGDMYLVHFNYTKPDDEFDIYKCKDFQSIVNKELDKLVEEHNANK